MTTLTCPKCRQGLADDALDLGQCPLCGFPLDGPMVLGTPGTRSGGTRLLLALGLVAVGAGVAGYVFMGRPNPEAKDELANRGNIAEASEPVLPVRHIAPLPHEPKHPDAGTTAQNPNTSPGDKGQPPVPVPPMPPGNVEMPGPAPVPVPPAVAVEPPKKDGPR